VMVMEVLYGLGGLFVVFLMVYFVYVLVCVEEF